jgi:hypothetical protein
MIPPVIRASPSCVSPPLGASLLERPWMVQNDRSMVCVVFLDLVHVIMFVDLALWSNSRKLSPDETLNADSRNPAARQHSDRSLHRAVTHCLTHNPHSLPADSPFTFEVHIIRGFASYACPSFPDARVPRMMILGNLPGHEPKSGGKPQEDSKEIL